MNTTFSKNGYQIISKFIDPDRAKNLYKIYSESYSLKEAQDYYANDPQVANSNYCVYNFREFLELLCEKTMDVAGFINEMVLPTYAYSRIYLNGGELKIHKDRPSCEVSITLHLDGDLPWPFYIKDFNGTVQEVHLTPGDAILYQGNLCEHWREPYQGQFYGQVFLHYVKSNNEYWKYYFDNKLEGGVSPGIYFF